MSVCAGAAKASGVYTSTAAILVLYILLIIVLRTF